MPDTIYVYGSPQKRNAYGFWGFVGDVFMTFLTCGLWLIYVFVREMRRER